MPKAPPGFAVDLFASGLNTPRVIRVAPNGDIFVAETGAGRVRVFRPAKSAPGRLKARSSPTACSDRTGSLSTLRGRTRASSMSRRRTRSCAFPIAAARRRPPARPRRSRALPSGGGHWTRDLAFSPDGKTLFVSVGSGSNVAEGAPRADRAEIAEAPARRLLRRRAAPRRRARLRSRRQDTSASTRPAFAIVRASRSSPEPARSGAPSTSATGSATTCRPTT